MRPWLSHLEIAVEVRRQSPPPAPLIVKVPDPAMLSNLLEHLARQRPRIRRRRIRSHVSRRSHSRYHRRNRRVAKTEAQRDLRQLLRSNAKIFRQPLHALPYLLLAVSSKILVPKVALRKLRLRPNLAGQAALIEGHAGDHANLVL